MSDPVVRLAIAEAAAVAARRRLQGTIGALQKRLEPKRLARDAARDLSDAGVDVAKRTANAARCNPGPLAGFVALAGLFLARHRIGALLPPHKATRDADGS